MSLTAEQRTIIRAAISERQKRRWLREDTTPRCSGCGGPHDARTAGCGPCSDRHRRRIRAANNVKRKGHCTGCSVPHSEYTLGCRSCNDRRTSRKKREKKRESAKGEA